MSFDFLLDPTTGDLDLTSDSDLKKVETIEDSFRQRLGIRLRTNRGEWQFDTTYGVPYTQQIIGLKLPKRDVDSIIQTEALREQDVDSILNYASEVAASIREYSAEFEVISEVGVIQVVLPSDPVDDFIYPEPDPTNLTVSCDLAGSIEAANDLYELINFDMPFEGDSTWYDVTGFFSGSSDLYEKVNLEIPDGGTMPWV